MEQLLSRYVYLYNHHIPQWALDRHRPAEMLHYWLEKKPECFVVSEINHAKPDGYILQFGTVHLNIFKPRCL